MKNFMPFVLRLWRLELMDPHLHPFHNGDKDPFLAGQLVRNYMILTYMSSLNLVLDSDAVKFMPLHRLAIGHLRQDSKTCNPKHAADALSLNINIIEHLYINPEFRSGLYLEGFVVAIAEALVTASTNPLAVRSSVGTLLRMRPEYIQSRMPSRMDRGISQGSAALGHFAMLLPR